MDKLGGVRSFSLLAVAAPLAVFVAACVGDVAPTGVIERGADASSDAASDATPKDAIADDVGSDATSDVGIDAPPSDAAVEAEASIPPPTCVDQTPVNGAYVHVGCKANASSVSPGGLMATGNYVNASLWQQPYCPISYAIGSATVFQQNGQTYFRYMLTRKTSSQDPGTTTYGTFWIQTNGNGDLTVQEMCNLQNKGQVKKGTLSIVGADYTFTWKDVNSVNIGQETWTKQ